MKRIFRLIKTGSLDAYRNMAFDEAVFLESCRTGIPVLRIYGWQAPSVSIGCSQMYSFDWHIPATLPVVRRMTGGGLLVHGNEITYSLMCAQADFGLPSSIPQSYKAICSFLIRFYEGLGLNASFAIDAADFSIRNKEGYTWCCASHEKYDILIAGKKIGGNAQKRKGTFLFQHGSIPLRPVFEGPSFGNSVPSGCALSDLIEHVPPTDTLEDALADSFCRTFDVACDPDSLHADETALYEELLEIKYKNDDWNKFRKEPHKAPVVE